ncbi:protein transport protein S31 [Ceratobasidium sp. UAMH 11750]|nr:protein transport protein S31 [Ceratobasidium sp. UAMH 11750]
MAHRQPLTVFKEGTTLQVNKDLRHPGDKQDTIPRDNKGRTVRRINKLPSGHVAVPPPPAPIDGKSPSAPPPVLPAAQRRDIPRWNDTPNVTVPQRCTPAPAGPSATAITSPFPNSAGFASPVTLCTSPSIRAAWRTWSPEDRHADRASSKGCTQGTEISAWRPRAYPRVRLSDLRGVERASCQVEAEYSPTTKTHVDDIERRLNALFDALNCETLSKPVVKQLITLVQAMQAHDGPGATAIHIDLLMRGSRTDDIGLWMSGAKQLIIRM